MTEKTTAFSVIYDSFTDRVTDDMYMEMSEIDTLREFQGMLINGLYRFKLPRFDIFDYELGEFEFLEGGYCGYESNYKQVPATAWVGGTFNCELTAEEVNILSLNMMIEWFIKQLAIVDNTRLRYTGSDFKMTSQANHLAKLKVMVDKAEEESKKLQDTYKRRVRVDGEIRSTLGSIMEKPDYGFKI